MDTEPEDRIRQLITVLEQIEHLLADHGERHWRGRLTRDIAAIKSHDAHGIARFLSAYGGMGSFNDLWLCAANGHRVGDSEAVSVNEKLSALRSGAYILAKELQRTIP
jgi:hypothetical protein